MIPVDFNLPFSVPETTILFGLSGSRAYGTNTLTSDTDFKGIFVPPQDYYLSPFKNIEQVGWKIKDGTTHIGSALDSIRNAEEEGAIFSLEKFFLLAAACNPNIVELLFTDEAHILQRTDAGQQLIKHRGLFLSQRAGRTFTGYAMNQLNRIKLHRRYLLAPPDHRPLRSEYDLPELPTLSDDQLGALKAFIRTNLNAIAPWLLDADNQHKAAFWESLVNIIALYENRPENQFDPNRDNWMLVEENIAEQICLQMSFDTNFVEYVKQEKLYSQALSEWNKYNEWKANHNRSRADLEAKHGYDTKHLMHLVRLLRMGNEILTEGKLLVLRPDAAELLAIRDGEWSYDYAEKWAQEQVDTIYDILRTNKCTLPKVPDQQALETLNQDVLNIHWNSK